MADVLVERLTGQESAEAVPVEVHLVMTDQALIGTPSRAASTGRAPTPAAPTPAARVARLLATVGARSHDVDPTDAPAWIVGSGPLPAAAARDLLDPSRDGTTGRARVWLRRLYTSPSTGQLVSMDSRRREFDGQLRRMLVLRDDTCRTPWCDAPIRHADHGAPFQAGGATSYANGSGLCERCNQTKEAGSWRYRASPEHLDVVTPTGHAYRASTTPMPPVAAAGRVPRRTARITTARRSSA